MLLKDVALLSEKLESKSSLKEKIGILKETFQKLNPEEGKIVFSLLSGIPLYGKLGVGFGILKEVLNVPYLKKKEINIFDVENLLKKLSYIKGEGSFKSKIFILREFFKDLSEIERKFLSSYLLSEVRHGAQEKLIFKALLKAKGIDERYEQKLRLRGNIIDTVYEVFLKGKNIIDEKLIDIFTPISPMLAESISEIEKDLIKGKRYLFEFKMDGARIQIHRKGKDVRIFTRNLKDVTDRFPEIKKFALSIPADSFILDAEAVCFDKKSLPLPFQEFMRIFGKKERRVEDIKITPFIFDILYFNGDFLLEQKLEKRIDILNQILPKENRMPYIITSHLDEARKFFEYSIERGHEGLLVKDLNSPYIAGKRGKYWFKWKKSDTLDLVIIGAEWGHGRRKGFLSNLHLACLDENGKNFLELGKTFKGLTDEMLYKIREILLKNVIEDDGFFVKVKPSLVVEIAYDEIVESPFYSSGFALRFARVKRLRFDKNIYEIANIKEIRRRFEIERSRKGKI